MHAPSTGRPSTAKTHQSSLRSRTDTILGTVLLQALFDMPNVIATTRPHVTIPHVFKAPDMKFKTKGFLPNQVQAYLERVVGPESGVVQETQRFLRKH